MPARLLGLAGALACTSVIALGADAAAAGALAIKLPQLLPSTNGGAPIELSMPRIELLPGVTVPSVSVSVPVPAVSSSETSGASSEPSAPVVTTPNPPSPPSKPTAEAPASTTSSTSTASASETAHAAGRPSGTGVQTGTITGGGGPSGAAKRAASKATGARHAHRRHPGSPSGVVSTGASVTVASAQPVKRTAAVTPIGKHSKHASSSPLASIGKDIPLPIPVPDWSKPIILALLALALWFGVRSRLAARRARRLEGQREVLLRDLDVMQAAVVPEVPASIGGLAVSVAYEPADGPAAGGDFYDVFSPEPGKVVLILGDVSGHGHQAVSHAALTRYTLRAYMQAGLEPRAALALAGRAMADPGGEHFATVAVGVYREREGTLTYASAGHPAPLISAAAARQSSEACCSPPIGWSVPTGRRQSTISLPAGTSVCFFTDGLIEARGHEQLLLGRERIEEIFDVLGERPQAAELLERVRDASSATPDDMAACVLTSQADGSSASIHVEELEVGAKALFGKSVPRFLMDCGLSARQGDRVIARAKTLAGEMGTALIRIELRQGVARATVNAVAARLEMASIVEAGPVRAQRVTDPLSIV